MKPQDPLSPVTSASVLLPSFPRTPDNYDLSGERIEPHLVFSPFTFVVEVLSSSRPRGRDLVRD